MSFEVTLSSFEEPLDDYYNLQSSYTTRTTETFHEATFSPSNHGCQMPRMIQFEK